MKRVIETYKNKKGHCVKEETIFDDEGRPLRKTVTTIYGGAKESNPFKEMDEALDALFNLVGKVGVETRRK